MSDTLQPYGPPIYADWTVEQLEKQLERWELDEADFWWMVANLLAARMRED